MNEWYDLADDELEARLKQRGVDPVLADNLVGYREFAWAAHEITQWLEP